MPWPPTATQPHGEQLPDSLQHERFRSRACLFRLVVGADKKGKLELTAKGAGGLKECCAQFVDSGVQYVWLRLNRTDDGGDSKRVKFVLLAWVGEVSTGARGAECKRRAALPVAPGCPFPAPSRERPHSVLAVSLCFAAQRDAQSEAAVRCTALLSAFPAWLFSVSLLLTQLTRLGARPRPL